MREPCAHSRAIHGSFGRATRRSRGLRTVCSPVLPHHSSCAKREKEGPAIRSCGSERRGPHRRTRVRSVPVISSAQPRGPCTYGSGFLAVDRLRCAEKAMRSRVRMSDPPTDTHPPRLRSQSHAESHILNFATACSACTPAPRNEANLTSAEKRLRCTCTSEAGNVCRPSDQRPGTMLVPGLLFLVSDPCRP